MKTVANIKNNGNLEGNYPLFLGKDLGFADTVNVTYPELEDLYKLQRSQFWTEEEFSLAKDKQQLRECDPSVRDIMILNLLSQWLMDSVASRSISQLLSPFVTNSELSSLLTNWSFFEDIHARDYSLIVRQCFDNPNEIIERGKKDVNVLYRCEIIAKVFNDTAKMGARVSLGELDMETDRDIIAPQLLKTMAAIYALESTAFMASFACTFALTREQFQGISKHVSSICNDEVLHAESGRRILSIMLHREGYSKYLPSVIGDIKQILDAVVRQEFSWADYVFSEGRKVIGLNAAVLKDYVRYVGVPMYSVFGLAWDETQFGKLPTHDPLPYMEKYIDRSMIQSANQEIENNSYRIAQTDDDLDDDEIIDF